MTLPPHCAYIVLTLHSCWLTCAQELHMKLETALLEVDTLKENRERQKEMVQAIINQRDMYRTLLAQATPLPEDSGLSLSRSYSGGHGTKEAEEPDMSSSAEGEESGARKELEEIKEQFEAYKKEKETNDRMLQQQLDSLRDNASELKIFNAKLESKVHVVAMAVVMLPWVLGQVTMVTSTCYHGYWSTVTCCSYIHNFVMGTVMLFPWLPIHVAWVLVLAVSI